MTEDKTCYRIPIGPQHPMYVEAENLEVKVDGETIVDVDINLGYLHRGIEKLAEGRNWTQNIYLFERICGICSGVHTITYCMMVEDLLGLEIPERAMYIRTVIGELERVHSHLLMLGAACYEIGLDTAFMYLWRDREHSMDMLEQISGNRVNYAMNTIGGVRRDIPKPIIPDLLKRTNHLEKKMYHYLGVLEKDRVIRNRAVGIGVLRKAEAERLSIIGPVARASGINFDVRRAKPYAAYDLVNWNVITTHDGDVLARLDVKIKETLQSLSIIRQCLHKLKRTEGDIAVKAPLIIPENEATVITEAPRGELFYYGKSNGGDKPERIKIRTPSYQNLHAYKAVLAGQNLADLPFIVASTDPCFSCCDRVTVIDTVGNKKVMAANDLRRMKR
jgi:NADH-quinone oxidoreductase subunit D